MIRLSMKLSIVFVFIAVAVNAEFVHHRAEGSDHEFTEFLSKRKKDINIDEFIRFMDMEEELKEIPIGHTDLTKLEKVIREKLHLGPGENDMPEGVGLDVWAAEAHWRAYRENQAIDEYLANKSTTVAPITVAPSATAVYDANDDKKPKLAKRMFRSQGKSRKLGKVKSVLTKVGSTIKRGAVKAKEFLKKYFVKAKEAFAKLKAKLSKQVARAKEVFLKAKGSKFVRLMNETVTVVYKSMPEEIKDMIVDQAMDMVLGSEEDLMKGMEELDFDPTSLSDDDELSFELDDYEELDGSSDEADDELLGDMSPAEQALFEASDDKAELRAFSGKKPENHHSHHKYNSGCCCLSVDGKVSSADDVKVDDLDKAEALQATLDDEEDLGLFNMTMKDFSPESAEEDMSLDLGEIEDMGDGDYDLDDESFLAEITKRSVKPTCSCSTSGFAKREVVRQRQAKKNGFRQMPSLTTVLPEAGAIAMLKQANVTKGDEFCLTKKVEGCVEIKGITMGALSSILTSKVMCPSCMFTFMSVAESKDNPFVKGWVFAFQNNPELDVFVYEAYKTYDGQNDLYDAHRNRWTLFPEGDDKFHWEFYTHL